MARQLFVVVTNLRHEHICNAESGNPRPTSMSHCACIYVCVCVARWRMVCGLRFVGTDHKCSMDSRARAHQYTIGVCTFSKNKKTKKKQPTKPCAIFVRSHRFPCCSGKEKTHKKKKTKVFPGIMLYQCRAKRLCSSPSTPLHRTRIS